MGQVLKAPIEIELKAKRQGKNFKDEPRGELRKELPGDGHKEWVWTVQC